MCYSHLQYTWDWFDYHVAKRVLGHLRELGDLGDTRSGRLFRAYYIAVRNSLRNSEEADFESPGAMDDAVDGNVDQRRSNSGSQPRQDSSDISTVVEDEVMHDIDTSKDLSDSQPSVVLYNNTGTQTLIITIRTPLPADGQLSRHTYH